MLDPLINARQPCAVFRGRTQELSELRQQAKKLPAGIFAITGAPGAGKTSLLNEFVTDFGSTVEGTPPPSSRPHQLKGVHPVTHIRLGTGLFSNPTRLVRVVQKLLRERDPWYVKFGREAGQLLGLIGESVSLTASVGDIDFHLQALQNFRDASPDSLVEPFDLLTALGNALPTGYLITIDEAQRLDSTTGRDYAIELLWLLADNPTQTESEFGNGWIILSGLSDTVDMLRRFDITRVDSVFSLGALAVEDATEVLTERIGEAELSSVSLGDRRVILDDWVPRLAEEYRQWPHHLEGAAVALQHVVQELPIDEDSFGEIRRIANQHRAQLYVQVLAALLDLNFRAWPVAVALAHYAFRHGDLIPIHVCQECVAIALESQDLAKQQNAIRQLCHAGLIQSHANFKGSPEVPGYCIPIPSLRNWLMERGSPDAGYRSLIDGNLSIV